MILCPRRSNCRTMDILQELQVHTFYTISCPQATTPYKQRAIVIAIHASTSVAEKEGRFKFAQIVNPG